MIMHREALTLCDLCPGRCCVEKMAKLAHCILAVSEVLHHLSAPPGPLSAGAVELLLNRCVTSCRVQYKKEPKLRGCFCNLGDSFNWSARLLI